MAAVAQRDIGDVADAEPVDVRHAGLDLVGDANPVRESSTTSPFSAITIESRDARVLREARVRGLHAVLAVDRKHGFRANQAEQRAQLFCPCVSRDVHVGVLLVQHFGAVLRQAG